MVRPLSLRELVSNFQLLHVNRVNKKVIILIKRIDTLAEEKTMSKMIVPTMSERFSLNSKNWQPGGQILHFNVMSLIC